MKLLEHPTSTKEPVEYLEKMLEKAREGKLTDFSMVYLEDGAPRMTNCFLDHKRLLFLGLYAMATKIIGNDLDWDAP